MMPAGQLPSSWHGSGVTQSWQHSWSSSSCRHEAAAAAARQTFLQLPGSEALTRLPLQLSQKQQKQGEQQGQMGLRGMWVVWLRAGVGLLARGGALGGEGLAGDGAGVHQLVSQQQQRWMQRVGTRTLLLLLLGKV